MALGYGNRARSAPFRRSHARPLRIPRADRRSVGAGAATALRPAEVDARPRPWFRSEVKKTLSSLLVLEPWAWPPEAAQQIVESLRDASREPEERLLAAELAGESVVAGELVAAALVEVAEEGALAAELRAQACLSLGPILEAYDWDADDGDAPISESTFEQIELALRGVHLDPSSPILVRRRALEAAVRAPLEWHADAVRAAWSSDTPEWRLTAVFAMRWLKGFEAEIEQALGTDDDSMLREALQAAASWGVGAAWRRAREIVGDDDAEPSLRLAAIEAVASLRPGEARAVLTPLLEDDELADVVSEALAMAGVGLDDEADEL